MHGGPTRDTAASSSHLLRLDELAPISEAPEDGSNASHLGDGSAEGSGLRHRHSKLGHRDHAPAPPTHSSRFEDKSSRMMPPSPWDVSDASSPGGQGPRLDAHMLLKGSYNWPVTQHGLA